MPENITYRIDQNLLEDQARPLGRRKGRRAIERDARRRGRRDRQRRQVRAHRGAEGVQGRPLRPEPDRQGRQARVEGAQTQGRGLRVREVIERYRRREESVEEALIDMYLAGVSTRQVDDISQLLWGDRMPSQTLSDKLKKVYGEIEAWRTRPLEERVPVRVHGRRVAQAVHGAGTWRTSASWSPSESTRSGHREVIGVAEGHEGGQATGREQFVRSMMPNAA